MMVLLLDEYFHDHRYVCIHSYNSLPLSSRHRFLPFHILYSTLYIKYSLGPGPKIPPPV